jgi:hypothetical protein
MRRYHKTRDYARHLIDYLFEHDSTAPVRHKLINACDDFDCALFALQTSTAQLIMNSDDDNTEIRGIKHKIDNSRGKLLDAIAETITHIQSLIRNDTP